MIVGLTGPSSSGKTTLVKALEKELGARVIEETARKVFAKKYSSFESLDELRKNPVAYLQYQLDVMLEQFELERKHENGILVTDRTIYDTYVYAKLFLPEPLFEVYKKEFDVVRKAAHYDLIFLCHPVKRELDGFRVKSDLSTQREQLEILKQILPSYVEVPPAPINERADFVLRRVIGKP